MCNRASFIAIRGGKIAWLQNSDSHDEIIRAEKLKDSELYARPFVRIECIPKNDPFSLNPLEWDVKEDEQELPSWYDREEWVSKILDELIHSRIPEEKRTGIIGNLEIKNGIYHFDWLTTAADVIADNGSISAPALTTAANVRADNGSKLEFPALTTAADVRAYNGSKLEFPALKKKRVRK